MADFPAMPLWTDAYLADTRHLSAAEHGAYLLLMMEAWRRPSGSLPDDDALLSRLACMSHNEWGAARENVLAFWVLDLKSKTWKQKRLSKERKYLEERRAKNRGAAAKRWNKTEKEDANAYAKAMPKASQPTPTPTPPVKEPSVPKKGTRIPDDFEPDVQAAVEIGLRPERALSEAAKFKDYWASATGAKATKMDWPRTWLVWARSAVDRQGGPRGSPAQGRSAFRQHQDDVTRNLERAANERPSDDYGQPAFDLDATAFRSDRTAPARKP